METNVSEAILYVTDDDFEDNVLNATQPVLVDYWGYHFAGSAPLGPVIHQYGLGRVEYVVFKIIVSNIKNSFAHVCINRVVYEVSSPMPICSELKASELGSLRRSVISA